MGWLFNRCKHQRIFVHTYARYEGGRADIIARCLIADCGKTLRFNMGVAAKETRDELAVIVLREYGYVPHSEENEWVKET